MNNVALNFACFGLLVAGLLPTKALAQGQLLQQVTNNGRQMVRQIASQQSGQARQIASQLGAAAGAIQQGINQQTAPTVPPFSPQTVGTAGGMRNGLPATTLDSFVYEAGEHKEHIYGDEGTVGLPPYMGFGKPHRINTGIMDQRDEGLTTGHGSLMPDAWGRDEFLGQEWTQSGARGRTSAMGFVDGMPDILGPGDDGSGSNQNLPPAPGPGYQPMYQHGEFVGWWSPEEIALSQTDFPAALRSIVNSDRYYGGEMGRLSILYEIGDIPSPFPPGYIGG